MDLIVTCTTDSGSVVNVDSEGWAIYLPADGSRDRGMRSVMGVLKAPIAPRVGHPLNLVVEQWDGEVAYLSTSAIAAFSVKAVATERVDALIFAGPITD